jgi:hypothetical protein
VDRGTDRDVAQRQRVARLDVGTRARLDRVADPQAGRGDDVGLLAVGVVQQRDPGGPVRVVLDRGDLGRDAVLDAPEVDDPVALLVPAALVPGGDAPVRVAAALLGAGREQLLLGP